MSKRPVYLDYAAATPLDADVEAVMAKWRGHYANPSSLYTAGRQAKHKLDASRHQAAQLLGCKPSEIVFTAGGTESVNLAVLGVARKYPGTHLITTKVEHASVLESFRALEQAGYQVSYLEVDSRGRIDPKQLATTITDTTTLISIGYVNSELGCIQPMSAIVRVVAQARAARHNSHPLWLHTDAAQAAGVLNCLPKAIGVDLLSLNGSKLYGPKSSGCLYIKTGVELSPLTYGGGQERGLRSGSEDVAQIVGFVLALEKAQLNAAREHQRLSSLRQQLITELGQGSLDFKLNTDLRQSVPSILNLGLPGINGETLVLYLDKEGFQVATGSACAARDDSPSHVLLAIGLTPDEANASLRISFGRATTAEQIQAFSQTLINTVEHLQKQSGVVK